MGQQLIPIISAPSHGGSKLHLLQGSSALRKPVSTRHLNQFTCFCTDHQRGLVVYQLPHWTCDWKGRRFKSQPLHFQITSNDLGQVVHPHVPKSTSSIIWYQSSGSDVLWLKKVTTGLALHWPCAIDLKWLIQLWDQGVRKGNEQSASNTLYLRTIMPNIHRSHYIHHTAIGKGSINVMRAGNAVPWCNSGTAEPRLN